MLVGFLFDDIIDNLDNYRNGVEKINTHSKHDNDIVFLVLCVFSVNTRPNRLSSTIDGNIECVHFKYSCLNVISVNSIFLSDKTINKSDIFRLKIIIEYLSEIYILSLLFKS